MTGTYLDRQDDRIIPIVNRANRVTEKLIALVEKNAYKGWDPYDGLNSRFLNALTFGLKWSRIAVMQFMKRSPVNMRPLFGIQKDINPKAMGILARAYMELYRKERQEGCRAKIVMLLDWLKNNCTAGYAGPAWGYNFDWQSAVFFIPRGGPTIVNTSFVAHAFLDAYELFEQQSYLDVARGACDFIMKDLKRTAKGDTFCFSYSPFDTTCTHNANMLGVDILVRTHAHTGESILIEHAGKALDFTLAHFNSDGSIYQGTAPAQRFIDSFHTGFILVCLIDIARNSELDDARYMRIARNAYNFYRLTFFEKDGLPRYYHNRIYPVDLHCTAQGIVTFLRYEELDHEAVARALSIAQWALDNMWDDKEGHFYFQMTRLFTNKIPYLRWPNIWMLYALSMLANALGT